LKIYVVYLTIVGGNLEIHAYYTMKCGMWVIKTLGRETGVKSNLEKGSSVVRVSPTLAPEDLGETTTSERP